MKQAQNKKMNADTKCISETALSVVKKKHLTSECQKDLSDDGHEKWQAPQSS